MPPEALETVDCMVGLKYNFSLHFRPNPQAQASEDARWAIERPKKALGLLSKL